VIRGSRRMKPNSNAGVPVIRPREDELAWSALSRAAAEQSLWRAKAANRWFLGFETPIAGPDLGVRGIRHARWVVDGADIGPRQVVLEHSLFPYYGAFLPDGAWASWLTKLPQSGRGVFTSLGINASRVALPRALRFCPACRTEDELRYGDPYWHRSHQVPGMLVCARHAEPLHRTSIPYRLVRRHEMPVADRERMYGIPDFEIQSEDEKAILVRVAELSTTLLGLSAPVPLNGPGWGDVYRRAAVGARLLRGGRIDHAAMEELMRSGFSERLLQFLGLAFKPRSESSWVRQMFQNSAKKHQPLEHIVLGLSLRPALGAYPWELAAIRWACPHIDVRADIAHVVTMDKARYASDLKTWNARFRCACGIRFTAYGAGAPGPDCMSVGRLIGMPAWYGEEARRLLGANSSLRSVARRLHLDPKTVLRVAAAREKPAVGKQVQEPTADQLAWLRLRRKYPAEGRGAIRKRAPDLYARLYRNHRSWLMKQGTAKDCVPSSSRKVDWGERDGELADSMQQSISHELKRLPLRRVTATRVGRLLGSSSLIDKKLDKLPRTRQLVTTACESVEQFQLRRLQRIEASAERNGQTVRPWKLMRLAGLRKGTVRPATLDRIKAQTR